ncbi:hypothetical protein MHYP_G00316090 [Metynnis hypsauchen]
MFKNDIIINVVVSFRSVPQGGALYFTVLCPQSQSLEPTVCYVLSEGQTCKEAAKKKRKKKCKSCCCFCFLLKWFWK